MKKYFSLVFFLLLFLLTPGISKLNAQTPTPRMCCVSKQSGILPFEISTATDLDRINSSEYKTNCQYQTGLSCDLDKNGIYKGHDVNHNIVSRSADDPLVSCFVCSHNNTSSFPDLKVSFPYWGPFFDNCENRNDIRYGSSFALESINTPCFDLPGDPSKNPKPTVAPTNESCKQCDLDHNNAFTDIDLALMYRCIPTHSHCSKIDIDGDGHATKKDLDAARVCQGDKNAFLGCADIDFNKDGQIKQLEYEMLIRCIDDNSNSCINHNPNGDDWFDRKDIDYCLNFCNKTNPTHFPTPEDSKYALSIRNLHKNTANYDYQIVKVLGETNFEYRPCDHEKISCNYYNDPECADCRPHKIIMLTNPNGVESPNDILDIRFHANRSNAPLAFHQAQNSCNLFEEKKPVIVEGRLTSRFMWNSSGYVNFNQIIEGRLQENRQDQWYVDLLSSKYLHDPYRKQYSEDVYGEITYCSPKYTPTPTRIPAKPSPTATQSTQCPVPTKPHKLADINNDGIVNLDDFEYIRTKNNKNIISIFDQDNDGLITAQDFRMWGEQYGRYLEEKNPKLQKHAKKVNLAILPEKITLSNQENTRIAVFMTGNPTAIDVEINFDSNFVQVMKITPGKSMPVVVNNKIENNKIIFSAAVDQITCVQSPGVLFYVDLKTLKSGKSTLNFNPKTTIAARNGVNVIGKLNNAQILIRKEKSGVAEQINAILQKIKPQLIPPSSPNISSVIFKTPEWFYDGVYKVEYIYLDSQGKMINSEGGLILVGKKHGVWEYGIPTDDNYCRWLAYSPFDQSTLLKAGIENCPLALTYKSSCGFEISYPYAWNAEKFFLVDRKEDCAYLTAPDISMLSDAREGLFMEFTHTNVGEKINNITVNTLADYVKAIEFYTSPKSTISTTQQTYGTHSGLEFVTNIFETKRSFIYLEGNQIYEISWPEEYPGIYKIFIDEIITSIKKS